MFVDKLIHYSIHVLINEFSSENVDIEKDNEVISLLKHN